MTVLVILLMLGAIVTGVLYVAARVVKAVHEFLRRFRPLWWFLTGQPMDGVARTDAKFLKAPTKALHPTAQDSWWHWRPGWHRAGIRVGAPLPVLPIGAGLLLATTLTEVVLALIAATGVLVAAGHACYRILTWHSERHDIRPLERTIATKLPKPLTLEVERDPETRAVNSVAMDWAPEVEIGPLEQEFVLQSVTTRLHFDTPDPAWQLKGRNRSVLFTKSDPPPLQVSWEDIEDAVMSAKPDELVFGIGKKGAIVKAKYSESPHIAIPGGSGGGKSNLAAFLLLQELHRGSLIFNLDPKWISHLWLQNLPNVINCHDIPDLHLALTWLGGELVRRTKAAYYSAAGTGRVRGKPGDRLITLCEELNYGMPGLKDLWDELVAQNKKLPKEDRDPTLPKKSPAVAGLSAMSCAGRASDIHEYLIAQLLTVESTGVKDSTIRTNAGIKAMARWDGPGWGMAVGKHIAMPPQTTIPGRIQVVTGDGLRETQVPYLHLDDKDEEVADKAVQWARAFATGGVVAQIPSGPEGVPWQLWPASVLGPERRAISAGGDAGTKGPVPSARAKMTLPEAYAKDLLAGWPSYEAARKAVQRAGLEPAVRGGPGVAHEYWVDDLDALAKAG